MAFFKTDITDLLKYAPVSADLSLDKILPDINYVEDSIVRPLIGAAQFDDIHTTFNTGTPTTAENYLIEKIQAAVANLALAYYSDVSQVSISNSGMQRRESTDLKTPFKYQADNVRSYFVQRGYEACEKLLEFLEENKNTYIIWRDSAAYTIHKDMLINSAKEFSSYYPINDSRISFMAMRHIMKFTEFSIEEVISAELMDEIRTELLAANLSLDNEALLDIYIRPAFAHLVIANALNDLPVAVVDGAVLIYSFKSPTGAELARPEPHALDVKKTVVGDRGQFYLKKAREYLNAKASATKYAAYFNSDSYEDPNEEVAEDEDSNIYGAF